MKVSLDFVFLKFDLPFCENSSSSSESLPVNTLLTFFGGVNADKMWCRWSLALFMSELIHYAQNWHVDVACRFYRLSVFHFLYKIVLFSVSQFPPKRFANGPELLYFATTLVISRIFRFHSALWVELDQISDTIGLQSNSPKNVSARTETAFTPRWVTLCLRLSLLSRCCWQWVPSLAAPPFASDYHIDGSMSTC